MPINPRHKATTEVERLVLKLIQFHEAGQIKRLGEEETKNFAEKRRIVGGAVK